MLINLGRLLMLMIWGFLLFNLIQPFPKPLKYFLDIVLFFMVVMHALQLTLLKATLTKDEAKPRAAFQERVFLFGVFEMVAWQKQQRAQRPAGRGR
ncbi:DUF1145 family protein [Candidatus Sodalis endolongispinus]|uniref:DUF1145 family protein n=1 Tax=Candidatus Sodalis endolongispinus TaxID=2812662 RepID=A0ABS5YC50_9GAMM|nr:DUF1145 family protein [Candidatus Sodalis endolongispinus]MBT9432194.1 DUF1145 family protein [Candidatus Sodalis endolongispinus]